MFFFRGDLKIVSIHDEAATVSLVSKFLDIPTLLIDKSGRWGDFDDGDGSEVYVCVCFGLEFILCKLAEGSSNEYGMTISSTGDGIEYNETEFEINIAAYAAMLLSRCTGLTVHLDD